MPAMFLVVNVFVPPALYLTGTKKICQVGVTVLSVVDLEKKEPVFV